MKRSMALGLVVGVLVVLVASLTPAYAQPECVPPPYSPASGECENEPEAGPGDVDVVTPCNRIIVSGRDWSGTTVTINRDFNDDDCPGRGDPPDVQVDTPPGGSNAGGNRSIPVAEDGTFSVALTVPADTPPGELEFTVTGQGRDGKRRSDAYRYEVVAASAFTPLPEEAGGRTMMSNLLVGVLAAAILGLGFNQFRTRRSRG